MPRFYFHLIDDYDAPDDNGVELPDLRAARQHAKHLVLFTASETVKSDGKLVLEHRIDIEDAAGNVLDTVRFMDVVAIY